MSTSIMSDLTTKTVSYTGQCSVSQAHIYTLKRDTAQHTQHSTTKDGTVLQLVNTSLKNTFGTHDNQQPCHIVTYQQYMKVSGAGSAHHPVHDELSKVGLQPEAGISQEGCEGGGQGVGLQLGRPVQGQSKHGHCQYVVALAHHIHLNIHTSLCMSARPFNTLTPRCSCRTQPFGSSKTYTNTIACPEPCRPRQHSPCCCNLERAIPWLATPAAYSASLSGLQCTDKALHKPKDKLAGQESVLVQQAFSGDVSFTLLGGHC